MNNNAGREISTIIERAKGLVGPGRVFAFVVVTGESDCSVGVAILGERGFAPGADRRSYLTYDEASSLVQRLNGGLGIARETAAAIVEDCARREYAAKDEARGVLSLKLSREEIETVRHSLADIGADAELLRKVEEALAELDRRSEAADVFSPRH